MTFLLWLVRKKMLALIQAFEDISVLKFTHECSDKDGSLPFLDVLVKPFDDKLHMKVHVKPTNASECLKANSECPDRYKRSVINNYLSRAHTISSNCDDFHLEIQRIRQLLINNGITNIMFDSCLNKYLNFRFSQKDGSQKKDSAHVIKLFYKVRCMQIIN